MFTKLLALAGDCARPRPPRRPLAPIHIEVQWETAFEERPRIRVLPLRGAVWVPTSDVRHALSPSADELAHGMRQSIATHRPAPVPVTLPVLSGCPGAAHEALGCVRISQLDALGAYWGCEARARYLRHYLSLALGEGGRVLTR
ncbi:hypothetical protein [Variovorax ginsengisoli]|uniref:Uncharacterized protein n=1 Tax=Variovorax ginsengisoli TaxID=363844 RepID=A0ABT8S372_9BURK|nr:hypothetical protein [Variovorax ginsengisoli]MDN8614209.1 hypothetical protein [Variovorax ginsengisoli]MDO1533379.1 hypothetical protein [Variovorax ginsengisoli]